MSSSIDEEESYLVPNTHSQTVQNEPVWCEIDEKGNLKFVDWKIVESLAADYDRTDISGRTDRLLIAKVMWLSRIETIREFVK